MGKKSKFLSVVMSSLALIGCNTLPSSGPNQSKVMAMQNDRNLVKVNVVELTPALVLQLYQEQRNNLFSGFSSVNTASNYAGEVNIGDVLEISIWEAAPAVLFGGTFSAEGQGSANLTKLPEQMVNSKGQVTVPFVGAISVAGKTPESIQNSIVASLSRKANQPQVLVRIVNNNSSDVTIIRQGNSIRMPLTANAERVLDAIAAVGGAPADIQEVTVQLTRDHQVKTLAFEDLIADPTQNIPLHSGDVVTLLHNAYSFTGLGAVGNNQQMKFSTKGITLAEAIGKMGGLIDTRSDPRGVFVFRYVPFKELSTQQQYEWRARGYSEGMDVPSVFRVNLLEPQSMFLLQRFPMRDKDIVYVSNAPLAEFQKFLRMIFSITSPVTSTVNSVNNM